MVVTEEGHTESRYGRVGDTCATPDGAGTLVEVYVDGPRKETLIHSLSTQAVVIR